MIEIYLRIIIAVMSVAGRWDTKICVNIAIFDPLPHGLVSNYSQIISVESPVVRMIAESLFTDGTQYV